MEKSRKRGMSGKGSMLAFNCHPEVFSSTREIIVGGVRALTGRTIRLVEQPLKPRSAERVGYFTDKIQSDKAFVEEYFRLRADPEIDVVPVTQNQLDEGIGERLDRIVRP